MFHLKIKMMEKKKVAVLAVNPVNGSGLFQYLEAFYENNISYKVYAVASTTTIRSNSGISLCADSVITELKGHENKFDALVFACGDAIPQFARHATESYNITLLEELQHFSEKGKIIIGHCAAALMFEKAGIIQGKKVAVHPLAKPAIQKGFATDNFIEIDGNFYTAQDEHKLTLLLPSVLEALKD